MTNRTPEQLADEYEEQHSVLHGATYEGREDDEPSMAVTFLDGYRAAIDEVLADLQIGIDTLDPGFAEELSYAAGRIRAKFAPRP